MKRIPETLAVACMYACIEKYEGENLLCWCVRVCGTLQNNRRSEGMLT